MATITRDAFLAERRKTLGASETAAALGVSPYASPIDLWQQKLGLAPEVEENEAMRWGKRLEPLILDAYQDLTGRRIVGTQIKLHHPDHSCLTATLDAVCEDGRIVEAKTTGWAREWGEVGSDEIPELYLVQVAQQLAITGATVADVPVLIGGQRLKIYTVERDDALIGRVINGALRFWDHVERREPPTWGRMDARALAVLNPECEGEAPWDLEDAEAIEQLVLRYEVDKREIEMIEARSEETKIAILSAMGNAKYGTLPDGRRIKRFLQEMPSRVVNYVAKAHTRHYFLVTKGEQ